ncbi:hypothetical protein CC78DRAFT_106970 [Lojkania enalia]|uniref:Uncharacterized protein n=1 Tax=Lojkania enalia TaxID=147567 RepID=A0A9P4KFJ8_9PLEO|nr:hypothetical protein CC78DRAFT_106970 [Didymosphaeria enalia]
MVLEDLDSLGPNGDFSNPPDHLGPPRYDASQLPQPIPIIGPLMGFTSEAIRLNVESTFSVAESKLHRRMTPEECQAMATHIHELEQGRSSFAAIGGVMGMWNWYKTIPTNRYPFYQPKPESITPNKFLFIKGPMAPYFRHSWRLLLYSVVGQQLGLLVSQFVVRPQAVRKSANDPRLLQFRQDLRAANGIDMRSGGRGVHGGQNTRQSHEMERTGMAPSRVGGGRPSSSTVEDDMSPTSGNDPWPSALSSSMSDYGSYPDSAQGRSQQSPSSIYSARSWPKSRNRADDDDASPTGGLFQDEVENQPKATESAWERLRRGGGPLPSQRVVPPRPEPGRKEQNEDSTLVDSFTFSESDEERRIARERAQREFDARIERERQGKDFSDDQRRW